MLFWKAYVRLIRSKFLLAKYSENDGLPFWREKLFYSLLLTLTPIAIIMYIPSLILSIKRGVWIIGGFDTIAIIILSLLIFNNKINLRLKKYLLLLCLYFIGIVLLIFLGEKGPGGVFLMGLSVMSVLILSSKVGYISLLVNLTIYILLGIFNYVPFFALPSYLNYPVGEWITITINFIGINAMVIFSIPILIDGLESYFRKEKELRERLVLEKIKLQEEKDKAILAEIEISKYREHLEELVQERTRELEDKNMELENYNQLFVGREFRIKELKDKIRKLENR